MLELYTDGSCLTNPGGPGGWGAILARDGRVVEELSGGEPETTNNRMEITAVIKGIERVPEGDAATVYSDSEYVVNTMTRGWNRRRNQDLWDQLDRLVAARSVSWQWVRGHATTELNNRADRLAVESAKQMMGHLNGSSNEEGVAGEESPPGLSHVDASGAARMVNVGEKPATRRRATASGTVVMQPETLKLIREDGFEKGDVFTLARVAGIMAAKRTHELIPLCHQIPLSQVLVELRVEGEDRVAIEATAEAEWKTGVEMEALTAVTAAALTVYDMCKSADRGMRIEDVRLLRKAGGRSGEWVSEG